MAYNPKQIVTRNISTFDFDKTLPENFNIVNDNYNQWVIGDATANSGTKSIYISYMDSIEKGSKLNEYLPAKSISHFSFDISIPKTALSAHLQFSYKGIGNAENAYLQIHQIESIAGASAGQLYSPYKGEALGWDPEIGHSNEEGKSYTFQSKWMNEIVKLDISDYRDDSKKILFTWFNDQKIEVNNPPIAIDDLKVYCTFFQHDAHQLKTT